MSTFCPDLATLLSRWCQTHVTYSQTTFTGLLTCLLELANKHRMKGLVLYHDRQKACQPIASLSTDNTPLKIQRLSARQLAVFSGELPDFLVILADRLCCMVYWQHEPHTSLCHGGWTFHPAETRHVGESIMAGLKPTRLGKSLLADLAHTQLDRRYDDRLDLLIPALVEGLEQRNHTLSQTLQQMEALHQRMIESERLAAIGQVSATIAHEIRNPLGLVDLYAQLTEAALHNTALKPAEKETILTPLRHVVSAIAHLEGFLAEITDYSRPFTLNCQPCHLYTLLRDMVDFCQPLAQQHQCALVLAPCPTKAKPWHVHIDISRIQQALLNLIKNALEASENKQNACVTVRLGCGSKPNDPLGIEVIDQGCGLGVGQAGKLFTPFFTTKAQGTGLGLARTQKIMQAHGGSVQAVDHTAQQAHGRADNAGDNAAPTGCTFTLALPKTCLVQNPTGLMS